jgi:hypothetical protein
MAVTMKNAFFWDVTPCRYFVIRRFGGTYRLLLRDIRNLRTMNQREEAAADYCNLQLHAQAGSLLVYFLYPEDGGDTFLRNVG